VLNYSWKASPNRWGSPEFNALYSIGFGNRDGLTTVTTESQCGLGMAACNFKFKLAPRGHPTLLSRPSTLCLVCHLARAAMMPKFELGS
jgi:hypothetical protein